MRPSKHMSTAATGAQASGAASQSLAPDEPDLLSFKMCLLIPSKLDDPQPFPRADRFSLSLLAHYSSWPVPTTNRSNSLVGNGLPTVFHALIQ